MAKQMKFLLTPITTAVITATAIIAVPPAHADISEDWVAAVCKPGTFANGHKLPNASTGALCMSSGGLIVSIDEYTSSFLMQNDVARYKGQGNPYAFKAAGGLYDLFLIMQPGFTTGAATALSPLAKYGFQFGAS